MKLRFLLLSGLLSLLWACRAADQTPPADPLHEVFRKQAQEQGLSLMQTEGRRLFTHYCETCHGPAGHGDGQNAYNLQPSPPDFTVSLRTHPSLYWRRIIEGGGAAVGRSPLCPPWGHALRQHEVDALIDYLGVLARPATPDSSPR